MIEIVVDRDRVFDDFETLMELLKSSFAYMDDRIDPPSSLHRLDPQKLREKAGCEFLLLAMEDGIVLGCLFARVSTLSLYIGKLAVDSKRHGEGIARLLMEAAQRLAGMEGKSVLELETRVELIENQRFFEHLGFIKAGENAHAGYNRPTSYCYQKSVDIAGLLKTEIR